MALGDPAQRRGDLVGLLAPEPPVPWSPELRATGASPRARPSPRRRTPRDRIRPRDLRGRPGHLPARAAAISSTPLAAATTAVSRRHRAPTPATPPDPPVRVASEAPRGCAASESRSIRSAARARVRADGARAPDARAADPARIRAAAFVVNVAALRSSAEGGRGGVQRGVRPQLEQGRAHPRAQHRRRVPQPAVQPQRERLCGAGSVKNRSGENGATSSRSAPTTTT